MKNQPKPLTRRDFLRGTVGATLTVSMLGVPWLKENAHASRSSSVFVIRDKAVMDSNLKVDTKRLQTMLDQAILHVTGENRVKEAWATLIKPEDIIGLVPTPHLNPTHPELFDVIKNTLVSVMNIPKKNIIDAQGGSRRPKKCSALISIPALKPHWLTGIGTVMKNYIMYSGRPTRYHEEKSAKLGEIWLQPEVKGKTKLIIVDALHPLCDKGPQVDPRYKWAYNGLIVGTDPVAVETVCLEVIAKKRDALRGEPWPLLPPPICLKAADKVYGLGTSKMSEITIKRIGWKQDILI
jgi:hypothetical protein